MDVNELSENLLNKLKEENKDMVENNHIDLTHWKDIAVVQLYIALVNYLE